MQAPVRETNAMAVVSLIAGILSWIVLPIIGSAAAIVCGHMARAQIRREPARYDGDGMAIAGLVLGWASVIVGLLTLLVVVLFFGGLAAVFAFAANQ
ncbi:hypothetical protein AZ78_4934 [Lysobacter capsici AZ78]|uniref:DUF4190 domain-containing protein n=1 Tax=Lysobacter capsici AZ78 TaxID=1444315 RepID=A0A108U484_9GAMM|nr:DUF4190 domain-containing protein [Lysobacter capsici]KWS02267.1 hypothetical protein AZ78_4934 [Lysobacter capsici AZ78]WND78705.1 DUF4190 domain-containing protein [Lysobacter capsici]WND83900.1 DUF4190 domain-containing protein [Lysobacter capsici]